MHYDTNRLHLDLGEKLFTIGKVEPPYAHENKTHLVGLRTCHDQEKTMIFILRTCNSPIGPLSSPYVAMMTLTFSTIR